MMRKNLPLKFWSTTLLVGVLLLPQTAALAWHDTGHMVIAQIAYNRLSSAARARVDKLLVPPPDRRGYVFFCDKTYDPLTIATWMDDLRVDSMHADLAPWHYINYKPIFDGIPARNIEPAQENVMARIEWCVETLKKGGDQDTFAANKNSAEVLGYLYHLAGDVHQPLHAATRYSSKNTDGDEGGNLFLVTMPEPTRIKNLHAYWDAAGGLFDFRSVKRPLDANGRAEIQHLAKSIMAAHPVTTFPQSKDINPKTWVEESNQLARQVVFAGISDGGAPSKAYGNRAKEVSQKRIALAGYRLAEVLNTIYK